VTVKDFVAHQPTQDQVRHWMTPNPCTVSPSETLDVALDQMRQFGVRHLPVLEDGRLIGIISDRDAERAAFRPDTRKPEPVCVRDVMRFTPLTVLEEDTLEEAARLLVHCRIGALPVVNPDGNLLGVISVVDLLCAAFGIPRCRASGTN
jgi:acetoin utilization protein AcuB